MSATTIFLSVVVPAYNESDRIRAPLREIGAYLGEQSYTAEIVVVDDGSVDGTLEAVCEVAADLPVPMKVLRYDQNRGKGHALKVGFAAAEGQQILFTDADLSTPIDETGRLLKVLEGGADIAIGTRKQPEAEIIVHQPWYRERMGWVFTCLVRALYTDVSDVTCGFKAFRGRVGRDIFSRVRVYDWCFDAEVLWIAKERGLVIGEVPVRWQDQPGTKVKLLPATLSSLLGLARILLNAVRGRYAMQTEADRALAVWPRPAVQPDPTPD